MKLLRFRVTNFRSVQDSGWIDTRDITALIGENESGKTNLLVPLWKLNPANNEAIDPLIDAPRSEYSQIRDLPDQPVFIRAEFELSDDLAAQLTKLTNTPPDHVRIASISRKLDGGYMVGFPAAAIERTVAKDAVVAALQAAASDISVIETKSIAEPALKDEVLSRLQDALHLTSIDTESLDVAVLQAITRELAVDLERASKRSLLAPRFGELLDTLQSWIEQASRQHPQEVAEARKLVLSRLPKFVYYSDYGNLDSEIYLPHVITNLERKDLGVKAHAKARTLKVLFDFVGLEPKEILELGQEPDRSQGELSAAQIEEIAHRKKEREVLLQSASSDLTKKFRSWWLQGDYRFRFQADGNHFRIWVSDDRRPEEIELEGRSRGLQWFFSFYLVFLVESSQGHKGAILLLDEPGLSLHPMAQEDLSRFFESLANTNQILYTTHSPFLVDSNHLDRVKAVFVDKQGKTAVSSNLRENEGPSHRSIYPVHAALNLSVSRTYLQGCTPVLVEGQSDVIYLSAIKLKLISEGRIKPRREIIFVPVGGARGVAPITAILVGRDEVLPDVLFDSDRVGLEMAKHLKDGLYQNDKNRVMTIDTVTGRAGDEIEDLFSIHSLARIVARQLPRTREEFDDVVDASRPFVPQVKEFAQRNSVSLPEGWKVDLATIMKERIIEGREDIPDDRLTRWQELFTKIG